MKRTELINRLRILELDISEIEGTSNKIRRGINVILDELEEINVE